MIDLPEKNGSTEINSRVSLKTVILLRTHFFDSHIESLADKLSQSGRYEVVILADHRAWCFPTGSYPAVSLTWERLGDLGLPTDIGHDLLWLCGDYGLYAAAEELRHADRFWLFEYDVVIHADDPTEVLQGLDDRSDADLLVTGLKRTHRDFIWARSLSREFNHLYRCNFPLVRLSQEAIKVMRRTRDRLADKLRAGELDWLQTDCYPYWPNDEALTATATMDAGLKCQDIAQVDRGLYSAKTFDVSTVLVHADSLAGVPTDGRIYHSVRVDRAYFIAATKKTSLLSSESLQRARRTLAAFAGRPWTVAEAETAIETVEQELRSRMTL